MDFKKPAILSISLLSVITNAAVAPILGLISQSFPYAGNTLIKQVVTIPSLMIIVFSIISGQLARILRKKTILAIGLSIYIISAFFSMQSQSIYTLIIFRAAMGAGAGLLIPLASSLITDFYSGKERAKMIGYSTFVSYIGAAIAPLIIGWFASEKWQDAFYIYLITFIVFILTMVFIPNKTIHQLPQEGKSKNIINISVFFLAIMGCAIYIVFYLMPTDVSFLIKNIENANTSSAASLLAIEIIAAATAGVLFSHFTRKIGVYAFPLGFGLMALGFFSVYQANNFLLLLISMIIIGLGIGTLRPLIYFRTAQINPNATMTTAFAFINGGFSLGQFISPFFYFAASSVLTLNPVKGSYLLASIVLTFSSLLALLVVFNRPVKLN